MTDEGTVQKNGFDLKPISKDAEAEEEKDDRGKWDNQVEFFLSCLGYAVGYGNVWRFPFLCYKNGGAVFLIPYGVMLIISGFPLFFMELALGQYFSLGPNILFGKLALVFKGLGYCMVLISILITIYFNVIFAWSLFYLFASFSSVLPWSTCENDFNSPNCYTKEDSVRCLIDGLLFFNKSCVAPEDFCGLANLDSLNTTFCIDGNTTSSDLVPVDTLFPRISSSEDYYRNRMLGVTDRTWSDMGSVRWEIVGCLALAWIMIGICMVKGVKSSGKVVYVTATAPYVVLTALLIRGSTLTGAYNGVEFYFLKANFTKLTEIEVWNDAATQIFYSLGVAAGVLITLSSYNPLKNNCLRDAVTIAFSNCLTSIFAGFTIFSILGFMANELQIDVRDVVESGSGLAFIAYPEAVTKMPFSNVWAVLFFVMLVSLGISSQFSYLETIVTAIFDRFPTLRPKKAQVTALIVVILFLCGVPMCLDGGVYMFELFVWYSAGISLIVAALSEVLIVTYGYGFNNFMHHIIVEMEVYMPRPMYWYFFIMWRFITPGALSVILVLSIYYYLPAYYGSYTFPTSIQGLGWLICITSVICIPLGAIWALRRTKKNWREAFKSNVKPPKKAVTGEEIATSQNTFRYTFDNTVYEGEKL